MNEFKNERRGGCSKSGTDVALIGNQIKDGTMPVFSKDKVEQVGFYCSSCIKIFCGGCSINFAGKSTGMGDPYCPFDQSLNFH